MDRSSSHEALPKKPLSNKGGGIGGWDLQSEKVEGASTIPQGWVKSDHAFSILYNPNLQPHFLAVHFFLFSGSTKFKPWAGLTSDPSMLARTYAPKKNDFVDCHAKTI